MNYANHFTVSYIRQNYITLFISTGILLVLVLIGQLLPRLLTKHSYERKVYSYNTTITNYAYFGYVLVEQVFGSAAMNNMMVFCIPASLYCYTFGVSMLMDKKVSFKSLLNTITVSIAFFSPVSVSDSFDFPAQTIHSAFSKTFIVGLGL